MKNNHSPLDVSNGEEATTGGTNMTSHAQHGFKGILGAERGKTYVPSAYGTGDKGGSAGGYGVGHGAAGGGGGAMGGGGPMPGYAGSSLGFEGGVRGGHVSEPETQPAQYQYPPKHGYDEHKDRGDGVHGVPGVEGMPGHAMADMGAGDQGQGDHGAAGHSCHACGMKRKTKHGLVSHMFNKHGARAVAHAFDKNISDTVDVKGVGQINPDTSAKHSPGAKAPKAMKDARPGKMSTQPVHTEDSGMGMTHGDSYEGKQTRGETEGPAEWSKTEAEFRAAQEKAGDPAMRVPHSSYATGDRG